MPITIVGSTFEAEWQRRNLRLVVDALQMDLLQRGLMSHNLHDRFMEIDVGGSGGLDEEEFASFVRLTGTLRRISPAQVRAVFNLLDANHDDEVTYKEISKAPCHRTRSPS